MKITTATLICLGLIGMRSASADMMFGDEDRIYIIQDIDYQLKENEGLSLGYRLTTTSFIAGIYITDNGYVLVPQRNTDLYYPLDNEEIKALQVEGALSDPLPTYEIGIMDYIFGYLLWILILIAALYVGLKEMFTDDSAAEET